MTKIMFLAVLLSCVGCGGGSGDGGVITPGPTFQSAAPAGAEGFRLAVRFSGDRALLDVYDRRSTAGFALTHLSVGFRLPAGLVAESIQIGPGWDTQFGEVPETTFGADGTGLMIATARRLSYGWMCEVGCSDTTEAAGDKLRLTLTARIVGAGTMPITFELPPGNDVGACDASCGGGGPFTGGVLYARSWEPPHGGTVVIP